MSTIANWTISINAPDGPDVLPDVNRFLSDRNQALNMFAEFFRRCAGSMEPGLVGETRIIVNKGTTQNPQAAASGTLTLSTASGSVGGIINNITKTVTAAGGDAATAILIRDAINADAALNKIVVATASGAVVTVSSLEPGVLGNAITFTASGTGVTASGSGRLAGGVGGDGQNIVIQF